MRDEKYKITYIANAGVLIEFGGTKILIDGIHSKKAGCFSTVPESILNKIINGEGQFNKIDYLLFTHNHNDHLDLQLVTKYISVNNNATLIMPKHKENERKHENFEQIKMIENKLLLDSPIGEMKEIKLSNIKIKYFKTIHEGDEYKYINNYSYIIYIGSKTFLHLGDAKPDYEFFADILLNEKIDYALLNFPYSILPSSRRIVKEIVCPKKLIVFHLPFESDDELGYRKRTIKIIKRYIEALPDTTVFLESMQEIID